MQWANHPGRKPFTSNSIPDKHKCCLNYQRLQPGMRVVACFFGHRTALLLRRREQDTTYIHLVLFSPKIDVTEPQKETWQTREHSSFLECSILLLWKTSLTAHFNHGQLAPSAPFFFPPPPPNTHTLQPNMLSLWLEPFLTKQVEFEGSVISTAQCGTITIKGDVSTVLEGILKENFLPKVSGKGGILAMTSYDLNQFTCIFIPWHTHTYIVAGVSTFKNISKVFLY